jgi:hypothetical protein
LLVALKCGDAPDVACQAKIAAQLHMERYIWGLMRKSPSNQVTVDLHLWQKDKPDVTQQFTFSDNLTEPLDTGLQKLAEDMLAKLDGVGKTGGAHITAAGVSGDLLIDGAPSGRMVNGVADVTTTVGDHRFEVSSGGKIAARGTGTVSATGAVSIQLSVVATSSAATGGTSDAWKVPVAIGAMGVGVALGVVGLTQTIANVSGSNDPDFKAYKSALPTSTDACDLARTGRISANPAAPSPDVIVSKCDAGKRALTLQWVFYPLAAVFAGAGGYLYYTTTKSEPTPKVGKVQVLPSAGLGSASVDLRVAF